MHLPHHPYPHRGVLLVGGGVHAGFGTELCHLQSPAADVLHPVTQDVQRPATVLEGLVQSRSEHVQEFRLRPCSFQCFRVSLLLGLLQPREQVLGEQRPLPVVAGVSGRIQPAVGVQVRADLGLEHNLVMIGHHTISRTSICPVTAAVINADRRSFESSMNRSVSAMSVSIFAVSMSSTARI